MENIGLSKTLGEKSEKITLKDYYYSLPSKINPRGNLIEEVACHCNVSSATVRNWFIYGMRPTEKAHRDYLSKLTGIPSSELWGE